MIQGGGGSGVGPWFKVLSRGSKLFQPLFRLVEDLSINFTCARSIFKEKTFIILGKV